MIYRLLRVEYICVCVCVCVCVCMFVCVCTHTHHINKLWEKNYGELIVRSQRFLQTNELAYHGFMDAGMKPEISESETKAVMTPGSAGNLGILSVPMSLASQTLQVTRKGPGGPCTLRGLWHS